MSKPKRIVQIAYDQALMFTRSMLLERAGFEVISLLGSKAARDVLRASENYDLFIIGHWAPEQERVQMAEWLRRRYSATKILALNPPYYPLLRGADFKC